MPADRPERICIVGAGGMLGTELVRLCGEFEPPVRFHALRAADMDITDGEAVGDVLTMLRPTLVLNAAAYTNVDGCESASETAMRVNGDGPGHLARACKSVGCRLVHVSSDYVFDGRKGTPYLPDDPVCPASAYGRSKAEGDRQIREILENHIIVRTSWLYAAHGSNFVRTMLRLAGERDELRVVDDQFGSPTFARDLAEALLLLGRTAPAGTHHFCNTGICSWNGFAAEIMRQAGITIPVKPMSSTELNRPAQRPAYSVLDTGRLTAQTGLKPRAWRDALRDCLLELESVAVQGVAQ